MSDKKESLAELLARLRNERGDAPPPISKRLKKALTGVRALETGEDPAAVLKALSEQGRDALVVTRGSDGMAILITDEKSNYRALKAHALVQSQDRFYLYTALDAAGKTRHYDRSYESTIIKLFNKLDLSGSPSL